MAATVGSKAVGTGATALVSSSVPLTFGVWVKAGEANTGNVHVGFANTVTASVAAATTDGYQLDAGHEVFIPVAAFASGSADAANVYIIATASSQAVTFLAY